MAAGDVFRQRSDGAYPLSDYDLRLIDPLVSLPEVIDEEAADLVGCDLVHPTPAPPTGEGEVAVEGAPIQLEDGTWTQTWQIVPAPPPPPPQPLTLAANPEDPMHAATKAYVDTEVAKLRAELLRGTD
jgi:hypothetical protein